MYAKQMLETVMKILEEIEVEDIEAIRVGGHPADPESGKTNIVIDIVLNTGPKETPNSSYYD